MSSKYRGQIHRFFVPSIPPVGELCTFTDENQSIVKVLRLDTDDAVVLIDGQGTVAQAKIDSLSKKQTTCLVTGKKTFEPSPIKATLIQGIPKMDRAEWIIQKCTELGVHDIQFVQTEHTVAHKKDSALDRWNKIALEACRQSGQSFVPQIGLHADLDSVLDKTSTATLNILCNEYEKETSLVGLLSRERKNFRSVCLAIGPEGGWSEKELLKFQKKSFNSVYLSGNILRVETASIVSLAISTSFMLES